MMRLAAQATEENGFVEPNMIKLLGEVWAALSRDHGIMGVIGPVGGNLEAAVLLRIGPMWYSDQIVLEEKAIFVHPDYRAAKIGRARLMCEFSKKVADTLNVPLMIGVLSNTRTAAKVKLYTRQFGEPAGAYFLYNARTGSLPETPA